MAGTSGCIPDYEVNLFGQLCKSALPLSAMTTSESEPQEAIDSQIDNIPMPQRTTIAFSGADPIAIAFKKHQHLIRGFSHGNAEVYLATVKEVFAEVRRGRTKACAEQPQERQLAEFDSIEQHDEHAAQCQNQYQVEQQKQQSVQQEDQHQPQHQQQSQHRRQSSPEQTARTAPSRIIPQNQKNAQRRFPSPSKRRNVLPCITCVLENHEKRCDRRR